MAPQLILKHQSWSQVDPAQGETLRSNPKALADFLASPNTGRTRLGPYWHAVPYLLEGIPKGWDEPYRWFVEGGEVLGSNPAGDIRYLSPDQVAKLAEALEDEEPDELGAMTYDEAKMDSLGIFPVRWVRWSEETDPLGTMRELYSYVREVVGKSAAEKLGLLIHLEDEVIDEEERDEPVQAAPQPTPPAQLSGESIFVGHEGRKYHVIDARQHPKAKPNVLADIDGKLAALGYRHLGDFAMDSDPGDTIRTYLSSDNTIVAIQYFSSFAVGGCQLLCRLADDALLVVSNAFAREVKKARYFAEYLQNQEPAALHSALLARREKLVAKYGEPVVLEPTLESAARVWDEQSTRLAGVR